MMRKKYKLNNKKVAIEHNGEIIPKANYKKKNLGDNSITYIGKTTSSEELVLYDESHTRIKLNSGYKHF